jgi:ribonuclease-3
MVDQDYLMTLEEGTYAMIIGRSCTERMDENLLCLKEMVASRGYEAAEKYILSFIIPAIRDVQKFGGKDFKTLLQELYQKKCKACPVYETVEISGPDHEQIFKVVVHLGNVTYGPAEGKSKKEAEQNVAEQAFITLKDL